MKIVCLSDTHGKHGEVEVPDGDVLVHAGDFTMAGTHREIASFADWLGMLPHKYKVVVAGNHDFGMAGEVGQELVREAGAVYLQDEVTSIEGLVFYGSPWTNRYRNWAFGADEGEEQRRIWAKMPEDVDVLITHSPPYYVLDGVPRPSGKPEHIGSTALRDRVDVVRPRLHIFGHVHAGAGTTQSKHTFFVNAAILDETYEVVTKPWSVDLDTKPWHVNLVAI